MMKTIVTCAFLTITVHLVGCREPENTARLVIRPDGTIFVQGERMTDAKDVTIHLTRIMQARGQPPVVEINTDDSVTHGQFVSGIVGPCAQAGIQTFLCRPHNRASFTEYPTVLSWTNEWKWHGMFTNDVELRTNLGVNLRVHADGVMINGNRARLSELPMRLSGGLSAGMGRASVTASDDARLKDVLDVLKACEEMKIDATIFLREDANTASHGTGCARP
jgi:biopolymer transport protein ExbD